MDDGPNLSSGRAHHPIGPWSPTRRGGHDGRMRAHAAPAGCGRRRGGAAATAAALLVVLGASACSAAGDTTERERQPSAATPTPSPTSAPTTSLRARQRDHRGRWGGPPGQGRRPGAGRRRARLDHAGHGGGAAARRHHRGREEVGAARRAGVHGDGPGVRLAVDRRVQHPGEGAAPRPGQREGAGAHRGSRGPGDPGRGVGRQRRGLRVGGHRRRPAHVGEDRPDHEQGRAPGAASRSASPRPAPGRAPSGRPTR